MIQLNHAELHRCCRVCGFSGSSQITLRMMEMGLTRGSLVTPVFEGMSGNICAYAVRDSIVALRNIDTERIEVSYE